MRRLLHVLLTAAVAVGAVAVPTAPAFADDQVVIRKVDTSAFPNVTLQVLPPTVAAAAEPVRVTENGKPVSAPDVKTITEAGVPLGLVLVLDTSKAMEDGSAIDKMKAAARELIAARTSNQKIALVVTSPSARTLVNFTDDRSLLTKAVDDLGTIGDSALWDASQLAAGLLRDNRDLQGNVVIVSGRSDQLSTDGAFGRARSQLRSAKAVVFPVNVQQRQPVSDEQLQTLATDTGGRFIETNDPGALTAILLGLQQDLAEQRVVTYRSSGGKALDIEVAMGTGKSLASVSPGTISEGTSVSPTRVAKSPLPGFLTGKTGLVVVAIVSLLGVGLLLYGLVEIIGNERNQLSRALRPYSDDVDERTDISRLADSAVIKKAVASTAKMASDRGLLENVQRRLEQADLPLRPAEALFFTAVSAVVAMLIGVALFELPGLVLAGLIFAYLPVAAMTFMAKRRHKKFTSQLPDTLQLLSGSLRAGYSLVQGIDAVSKQCEAPMGSELSRAMSEARLGRPVEEALQEVADRMGSDDFEWAVMAIKIQREVGGNLAELLMTVSETMVARERLRREVRALTAEGRMSAIVLTGLPFAIGLAISVLNPEYMQPLFSNFIGQVALVAAVIMILVGYWAMTKLMEIEA